MYSSTSSGSMCWNLVSRWSSIRLMLLPLRRTEAAAAAAAAAAEVAAGGGDTDIPLDTLTHFLANIFSRCIEIRTVLRSKNRQSEQAWSCWHLFYKQRTRRYWWWWGQHGRFLLPHWIPYQCSSSMNQAGLLNLKHEHNPFHSLL